MSDEVKPLNILLVDDRAENLLALEAVLSSPGYRLVQARSGTEAIEAFAKNDFVVILLDIQMPVMDGFETARLIRGSARGKDVPIVFITALDRDPKYVEVGYKLGAVDYVFKPFEPLALRAKVNLLADLYRRNIELARSREELRRSEIRFRLLVQGVKDYAIFMLSPEGNIQSWNEGAKRFKGYNADEIIGKHFSIFYPKEVALSGHPQRELEVAVRDGRYEEENWRVRKDGSTFWANIVITALHDDNGKLIGFSKVTRDLTERKQSEDQLRRSNEVLELKVRERTSQLEVAKKKLETLLEKARQSESQFRTLADSIPQLAWMTNADGYITWYNDRWYQYTGTTPEQMEGWGWQSVHAPEELPRVMARWKEALAAGLPWEDTFPLRSKSGEWRWFLSRALPIRNDSGEIVSWFGTNTDIEEARRARETLKNSAETLKLAVAERTRELAKSQIFLDSVIENIPNMVFVKSAKDLRFVRFNKAGEGLLGYSRTELIGKNDYDFFPKDEAEHFVSKDRQVLSGGSVLDIPEETIETKTQGRRILHTRKIPIFDSEGNPEYLLGISEDITEQKRTEAERLKIVSEQAALEERKRENQRSTFLAEASTALASSLDYHRTLRDLAQLAVPAIADWCTVTIVNEDRTKERVAAVHRDSSKSALIENLAKYYPVSADEDAGIGHVIKTGKCLFTPKVNDSELVAAAKDQRHLEIMRELGCSSCILAPITTRGKVFGAISLVSSRLGRVYNENDLSLAEELGRRAGIAIDNAFLYEAAQSAIRAREEFMSIASHELKTPLTSLKLQIEMANRLVKPEQNLAPSPEKLAKVFGSSTQQISRLGKLVEEFLDVSKIQAGKLSFHFEEMDLCELVKELVERLSDQAKEAECPFEINICKPEIRGIWDRGRIEQTVLNLLSNAIKYAPGKPIIVSVFGDEQKATLIVQDFGPGIPKDKQARVFERFERVTESRSISGLGLGLFIVKEIVTAHQGKVRVESEVDYGSSFIVELPLRQIETSGGLTVKQKDRNERDLAV